MPILKKPNLYLIMTLIFSISPPIFANQSSLLGPYLGVYLGGGFGRNQISTNTGSITNTTYFSNSADIDSVNNTGTWQKNSNAFIFGVQGGHDWMWKKATYGVVLDYGSLPLNFSSTETRSYPSESNQYSMNTSIKTNWLFTLRGKLGYQQDLKYPSMFYLTGGMAMTNLKVNNAFSDNTNLAGIGGTQLNENQIGWTIGTGLEVARFQHTTIHLEYLFIDIPSATTTNNIDNSVGGFGIQEKSLSSPFYTKANFYANLIQFGISYRFDEK